VGGDDRRVELDGSPGVRAAPARRRGVARGNAGGVQPRRGDDRRGPPGRGGGGRVGGGGGRGPLLDPRRDPPRGAGRAVRVTELEAMRRALFLARRGWGRVHPNPMVGAVVLAQGEIAGEGYHAEYGGEHAERAALAAAGERARGATLVATLEPCGHTGKQPPCVEAILAAGIRRVVAAAADPNPEAGGGAGRLRTAGVDVELGLLEREAR